MHAVAVNWLAVVVSAFVVYVIGAVWFSPVLFQRQWSALTKMDDQPPDRAGMALGMVLGALITVVQAMAMGVLVGWSGAANIVEGAAVGLLVGIGVAAVDSAKLIAYERRPLALFAINNSYTVLGFFLMGAILAVWR